MIRPALAFVATLLSLCVCSSVARASPDIVIADFEGSDYGGWVSTGSAFGAGPAQGTLPGQQAVTGFAGHGLANSFLGGDASTGTLTSPQFQIQRKYITFLIGGGDHPDSAYMALLVDGKIVCKATGDNAEALSPKCWKVANLVGKQSRIVIVDNATGGWGHINVDDIIQSDSPHGPVVGSDAPLIEAQKTIMVSRNYMNIPVYDSGISRGTDLLVDGKLVSHLDIRFADDGQGSRFYGYDVRRFKGKSLTLKVGGIPADSIALSSITQGDELPGASNPYNEPLRPLVHFTTQRGWINDPNGLVYFGGEYHLFYQLDPLSTRGGNKHWGHAVSKDLFHWKELPIALFPGINSSGHPYDIWSGSAAVDWHNSAGLQTGKDPALVAFYTGAGNPFEQHLAFSNDRGRTWTQYAGNPVVPHIIGGDRDPKVVWDEAAKLWALAVYLDGSDYALFTSHDLKNWARLDGVVNIGNAGECPDFFKINLDNDSAKPFWVFTSASGRYVAGSFDGHHFVYNGQGLRVEYGGSYAVQSYNDIPASDGRRIQVGWLVHDLPDMPFNQQLSIPCELTLHSTPGGPRLYKYPVKEIETLYDRSNKLKDVTVAPGVNPLNSLKGEAMDIDAEIEVGRASEIDFSFRGKTVKYSAARAELQAPSGSAPLASVNGRIRLRFIVDRASVEVFVNDGQAAISSPGLPVAGTPDAVMSVIGGQSRIITLTVRSLKSIWH